MDPNVCSGHGTCIGMDDCECDFGWTGMNCSSPAVEILCNGIDDDMNPSTPDDKNDDGDSVSYCNGDCDDNDAARYPGNAEVCDAIDNDCDGLADEDGVCIVCGNGILETGEECDDGNTDGGDGCSSTCTIEALPDADGDGVLDDADMCPETEEGAVVDEVGCSGAQRVANECPADGEYKNHGKYVSCVAHAAEALLEDGLITEEEKDAIVSAVAKSDVGKPTKGKK